MTGAEEAKEPPRLISLDRGGSVVVKPNVIGVYRISCIANGVVYVGSSKDVFARISGHKAKLRSGKHGIRRLVADFVKYGENAFEFEILSLHDNVAQAVASEADVISEAKLRGDVYNTLAIKHYTRLKPARKSVSSRKLTHDFNPSGKLIVWMERYGKPISAINKVLGRSRWSAYRLLRGEIPTYETMLAIYKWTEGAVTPNDFFDLEDQAVLLGKAAA